MLPSPRVAWCVWAIVAASVQAADTRFPFVIPGDDATTSATDMATLSPRAAGADGFVRVKDGHFYTEAGRLRIWGVNTCFAGNFPEHADAEKVAAHLAKLGINAVRMHHHDTSPAPRGIWGPVVDGHRTLSPEQLDRQDYFLNELHRHGIYANLNLHVGREVGPAEGVSREGLPYATRYDKYLEYYMPQMRAKLKEFAREYLLHENPYRKLRRVDDPGIAMIEITNENSFSKLGPEIAAGLPEPFRGEFKRQWNEWLARRYGTTAALQQAWSAANEPLGAPVATSDAWRTGTGTWRVKQNQQYPVTLRFGQPDADGKPTALRVEPKGVATELSAQELHFPDLRLVPGQAYTLSFWVNAEAARSVYLDVSRMGPGDWSSVGLHETLNLKPGWQRVQRVFRAAANLKGLARICFKYGGSPVAFTLAGLTLRPGSDWVIVPPGQTVEARSIEIPTTNWTDPAQRDVHQFMEDTERGFIEDLMVYLKQDLGVRVPITCSQITYTTPAIVAATCDYADIHAYWQHPRFPHKPWDPVDWNIRNSPMETSPDADALLERATWRLLDRPFTMSEWNIPDPNDFAGSVAPFAALVASLQDWDGIFFFQYAGGDSGWYADSIQRFFSFNGQPVKLALLTACAEVFRRGDIPALTNVIAGTLDKRVPSTLAFSGRIGIDPRAAQAATVSPPAGKRLATPNGSAVWDASDAARAHVEVDTPLTRAVWGLVAERSFALGDVKLSIGAIERDYAAVVLTSLDGKPLAQTTRALLVAASSAQNTGMKWNDARTSVGKDWGRGPAQVNAVPLELTLPRAGAHVFALDGRGQRVREVAGTSGGATSTFSLGADARTLWYEIVWLESQPPAQ